MIKDKIRETIRSNNLIEKGDIVILGLSGGPDSVCLFHVLMELSSEMDFELHGAHVNHQFRKEESDEDQLYVENLCEGSGVCCWSMTVDCNQISRDMRLSAEEAGRKARYDFFAEITESLIFEGRDREKIKIAIAQNLNDQIETVIFRFIRGTGTDGLAGIDYKRINEHGNVVIRPLLDVNRKDILEYINKKHIKPCIDYTNSQPIYTRNKIRLELIPNIEKEYNANLFESINKLSKISREDRHYLWNEADKEYDKIISRKEDNEIWLNHKKLRGLHYAIRHRVILKAFGKVGLPKDILYTHLKNADELIENGITPQQISFPKGYVMRVSYDDIVCGIKPESEEVKLPQIFINIFDIDKYGERKGVAAFDLDKMEGEYGRSGIQKIIKVRNREPGDFIRIVGVLGRKKIQDLLVDMKVPKEMRNKLLMVAIGHEVLWIPSREFKGRYSCNYKVDGETKRVITVEVENFV